jgi:hypothetical protein
MGSVSEAVTWHAKCSVEVVRPGSQPQASGKNAEVIAKHFFPRANSRKREYTAGTYSLARSNRTDRLFSRDIRDDCSSQMRLGSEQYHNSNTPNLPN